MGTLEIDDEVQLIAGVGAVISEAERGVIDGQVERTDVDVQITKRLRELRPDTSAI